MLNFQFYDLRRLHQFPEIITLITCQITVHACTVPLIRIIKNFALQNCIKYRYIFLHLKDARVFGKFVFLFKYDKLHLKNVGKV
jgi:hypothetical protein